MEHMLEYLKWMSPNMTVKLVLTANAHYKNSTTDETEASSMRFNT